MGYWGTHPMEGDSPLDDVGEVEGWLIDTLIQDIQTEESTGKDENISDSLRNFVIERNFDREKIFWDFTDEKYDDVLYRDLWNTYKYNLIAQFKDEKTEYDENTYFVIPFKFIDMDIHVKSKYVSYLIEMLGDGGSVKRGYDIGCYLENKEYIEYTLENFISSGIKQHPYYNVLLVKKYANQLFDESNNELNDDFVAKHPEITDVISKGLFQSIAEKLENGNKNLVNVN